mgnify:CR=1 FL=1
MSEKNHPTHQTTEVLNPDSEYPVLMFCEHAGNRLPPEVAPYLGMDNDFLDSYHGYDIGIPHIARRVAHNLNATCVLGVYSRLLIDLNRKLDAPDLLHDHDDYIDIPGNQNLSKEDLQYRIDNYWQPYHDICEYHIQRLMKLYKKPVVFSFHSFPRHQTSYDKPFPWNFTIHYHEDFGVAEVFRQFFKNNYPDVHLGDNEPYNLKEYPYIGTTLHGEEHGLPNLLIEIPNDQMLVPEDIEHWTKICTEVLGELPAALGADQKKAA